MWQPEQAGCTVNFATQIENPQKWSAETPNLYQLKFINIKNDKGELIESIVATKSVSIILKSRTVNFA